MKHNYLKSSKIIALSFFTMFSAISFAQSPVTNTFVYTGATVNFTVPPCVTTITMQAWGAQGGDVANSGTLVSHPAGLGAYMSGVFAVTTGQVLKILVGGKGVDLGGVSVATGGGGGSFIATISNTLSPTPMLVAGGGGGRRGDIAAGSTTVMTAVVTTAAQNCGYTPGTAGLNGNGGTSAEPFGLGTGGPGGGFYTNGGPCGSPGGAQPGNSFLNGGAIALTCSPFTSGTSSNGGFGGGGGGCWCYRGTPGGGGGFSGGGSGSNDPAGGGGGSYNAGTNQSNLAGVRQGNGLVVISYFYAGALTGVAATPTAVCIGSTSTLTANGQVTYTWNPGGSNSNSITVSPTTNSTYTIQGTNVQGCVSTTVVSIAVNTAVPTLSLTSTASVLCLNKTVTFNASGATTYTWTNGITNGVPYFPAGVGNPTYVVTGENACGTSTLAATVTVNPLPSITASINNPTVCTGNPIILNGGGGVGSYTWSPSAQNNVAFNPPVTANYTVTGAAANGCTSTAVVGVTVLITPTITPVVTPTAMCIGNTATLSAVGATGYTWTPGTLPNAPTVTVSPPIPTTYTLVRTNGACSSTSTVNLIIYPLPLVAATASPSQICIGTGVNMVVLGPITNTWLPGGFTASNFTLFPNFSTTYTVTGSNGNCTATAVVPVIVNPTPTLTLQSSTNTICAGNSVTLNGGGALTYTWSPSLNINNTTEMVTPPTTTIITLAGTNSFGCSTSIQQLIVVYPVPNMSLTSSLQFVCANQTAVLSIANPSTTVVYNWSTGPVGTSIQVNPAVTSSYIAIGTNTQTGCQNSNTLTLAVYISTFAVTNPTAICKGDVAVLSAAGQATSYSWTANGGVTAQSVTVNPIVNTTYYVTGFNGSCQNTQTVPIVVNPLPNVTASVAKSQICRFEISTITGNGATSYSWNTGATTPTISFNLSISTNYTLTGTDLNNCSKTVTVTQFVATCIGAEDLEGNNIGLNIYPNPNNGNFTIRSGVTVSLNIINTLGQVVHSLKINEGDKKDVTVSNLPTGIYFITGETNGLKVNKKIIIER